MRDLPAGLARAASPTPMRFVDVAIAIVIAAVATAVGAYAADLVQMTVEA